MLLLRLKPGLDLALGVFGLLTVPETRVQPELNLLGELPHLGLERGLLRGKLQPDHPQLVLEIINPAACRKMGALGEDERR
mgnify:CR=1 FL=1